MEIKCTPQELKELLNNKTSADGTTDVVIKLNSEKIADNLISPLEQCHNY